MARKLRKQGYTNVFALKGGFEEWVSRGYAIETKAGPDTTDLP